MATTKVFLTSPGIAVESIVEGATTLAVQSSFLISVQYNNATGLITDGSTTRAVNKKDVLQALIEISEYITKDPNSDWG